MATPTESIPGREEVPAGEQAPPAEPMTKAAALVYVQHLLVTCLEGEIAGFKAMAAAEGVPELDRKDAALVAEVAEQVQKDLSLANTVIMASEQRVQLAAAGIPTIGVPGAKAPRGGR